MNLGNLLCLFSFLVRPNSKCLHFMWLLPVHTALWRALILSCLSLVSCPATSYPNPGQVGRRGGTNIHHLRPGKERRAAEDEMVRWDHQLSIHECEQAPGDVEGQRSPVYCRPWMSQSQTQLSNNIRLLNLGSVFSHSLQCVCLTKVTCILAISCSSVSIS